MSLPMGQYLYSQLIFTPPKPTQKYSGQTVLITGANIGLGLEAARWFVKLDAQKVILAVRSLEKGEAAKHSIEESENKTGIVEVWQLDLSSYQSVKDNAKKAEGLERLDVVVENAGIVTYKWQMMEESESTITTNVVSPLLHGLLLLPKLRETSVKFNTIPKMVFTGSFVHWLTTLTEQSEAHIFDALSDKTKMKPDMGDRWVARILHCVSLRYAHHHKNRYYVSKLLEMHAIRELADLSKASSKPGKVIINVLNPGWVVTNIMTDNYTGFGKFLFWIGCLVFARSTEVGSRTILNAAEGGDETHGQYLDDCKPGR